MGSPLGSCKHLKCLVSFEQQYNRRITAATLDNHSGSDTRYTTARLIGEKQSLPCFNDIKTEADAA